MMETHFNCGRWLMTLFMFLHTSAFLQGQMDYVYAQDEDPYLLYADHETLYRINLDGSENRMLQREQSRSISGVDFNFREKTIYWTDIHRLQIVQSNFNFSTVSVVTDFNLKAPEGLAADWINNKLYWTDRMSKTIEVLDLHTRDRKVLIHTGENSLPRSIVVDPIRRWLYWSDWNTDTNSSKIGRVSMDGQNISTIHDFTTVQWPNGLTIDYTDRILYWIDAKYDQIGSSNLDGSSKRIVTSITDSHPFFLSYYSSSLYWTTWGRGDTTVKHLRVFGRGGAGGVAANGEELLVNLTSQFNPTGVQVISIDRQPSANNPCSNNNGGCSNLCLLSAVDRRGYTCACPDGVELKKNGRDCVGAVPRTTIPTEVTTTNEQPKVDETEQPEDVCETNPCGNGGTCIADGSAFTCDCTEQYSGPRCLQLNSSGSGEQDISVIVFMGVVGGLILIILMMLFFFMFIFFSVRWRSHRSEKANKQRSQSLSGLSSTSSRDSPPRVVVVNTTEHDYMSIKSRDSPTHKGIYICNIGNGTDGRSVQNPYTLGPHPLHQSASSSELLTDSSTPMVNGSKTMKLENHEPIYNNVKTKVQTL